MRYPKAIRAEVAAIKAERFDDKTYDSQHDVCDDCGCYWFGHDSNVGKSHDIWYPDPQHVYLKGGECDCRESSHNLYKVLEGRKLADFEADKKARIKALVEPHKYVSA